MSTWDAQERIGEVRLSDRSTLLVSLVRRAGRWYVRMQTHRWEGEGNAARWVLGNHGLILRIEVIGEVDTALWVAVSSHVNVPGRPPAESVTRCVAGCRPHGARSLG